jgi:SAM-dependent methyltransferase
MEAHEWDQRYAEKELVWSSEPNVFVAQTVADLPPGRALDVACGEGRNAIWLASKGWKATGVDFSQVAIDKAKQLAQRAGVSVEWVCADVTAWQPPASSFDLILFSYLHLPPEKMTETLGHAKKALAPGGLLFIVGHAKKNLTEGYGGPPFSEVLYEPEDLLAWLEKTGGESLAVERAENVVREVDTPEGPKRAIDTLVLARAPREKDA